jgi:hypothetical protein
MTPPRASAGDAWLMAVARNPTVIRAIFMITPAVHRSIRSTADDFAWSSRFCERRYRKTHFAPFDRQMHGTKKC